MIAHLEAEQAVMGGLLIGADDPHALATATRLLPDPAMFTDPRHRALYRAIRELADEGTAQDHITLTRRLAVHHASAEVSVDYLAELVDMVATTANLAFHAQQVRDAWQRREAIAQAEAVITLAKDLRQPVGLTIRDAVDKLSATHQASTARAVVPMSTGMLDVLDDLERQATIGTVLGTSSGLPDLDAMTHGFQPGELWIVGARPSMGKSSFVADAALAAAEIGPVLFLSAEMPAKAIRRRMLARTSGVNLWSIRDHGTWDTLATRVNTAAQDLGRLPLRIDDTRHTATDIRLAVSEWIAEMSRPPVLVVVDYLQKLHAGRRAENRNIEIGYITGALARCALDLEVPILCAAQLSRSSVKDGKPRRPNMSDLRDSGNIEQDADGIILLHHPPTDPGTLPDHTWLMEVIVEKNRNGETGLLHAYHDRSTGTWTALDFHQRKALRNAA